VDWLVEEVSRLGAGVRCSTPVTGRDVAAWPAESQIFVAIGAEPVVEPLPGAERVLSLEQAIAEAGHLDSPVVIVDEIDDEPVYSAAVMLAGQGHRVAVVTRRAQLARHVAYVSLIGVLRRLDESGIEIHTLGSPARVEGGQLVLQHPFSGREHVSGPAATIVRAGPYRSRSLELPPGRQGIVVGDASSPRSIAAVMREARAVAEARLWR
jgi:hypothetical protein